MLDNRGYHDWTREINQRPEPNWKVYNDLSCFIKGDKPVTGMYTVEDVDALRDNTNIGDKIKFRVEIYRRTDAYGGHTKPITVEGRVKAKYPYIFMLEDGKTYSWVDYLLGKQM